MFLDLMKNQLNMTYTENGALTYRTTASSCLDLFATIGALRTAKDEEICARFQNAFAENADLAMKILFYARDIRGGLGERRVFKTILGWLAVAEPEAVRKNIAHVAEYGRYDDLLALMGTPCEAEALAYIAETLRKDILANEKGEAVTLLAKWLPSVNASNVMTVKNAKKIARALGMSDAQYRKVLTSLRGQIKIIENNLREKDYTFDYEKQPSKALFKYRQAFSRNDGERYGAFLSLAEERPSAMHTGTLTPYDVVLPIVRGDDGWEAMDEAQRRSMDVTWKALENYAGAENALAVVDGSGSMYWGEGYFPAAVAQSLGIYFAEHNTGAFHNYFITFSTKPQLVEVKGSDIVEKVRYCMSYNECANTDLMKTFELILKVAVKNHLHQEDLPAKLYVISDMEFDCGTRGSSVTNFEAAKEEFAKKGYRLPQVVFWNVASRNRQQPVTQNEQGVALVSGCSPQIFGMLAKDILDPYAFMMEVLGSARYAMIAA
ncbi:MAG: DUF2828 family protein [Lachnospiraceae bacterium]|nr:DUF2828 family protein [Lachnospiraceae bacterium]